MTIESYLLVFLILIQIVQTIIFHNKLTINQEDKVSLRRIFPKKAQIINPKNPLDEIDI